MKVLLSFHLKIRLKERKIPRNYPSKILSKPDAQFVDIATNHRIAIKDLEYNFKSRPMVVVYDIIGIKVQVITIHPTTNKEIGNKLKRGRWVKNEKN